MVGRVIDEAANGTAKRQKRSKFGRESMRSVTRTTRRVPRKEVLAQSENNDDDDDDDDEFLDDEDDDVVSDNETVKNTIASKRSNKGMNKMAYSALVTLLKTEHGTEDAEDDLLVDENKGENDVQEQESEDEQFSDGEEVLNDEEKHQDDVDVLNKYDSFNLHFNKEDEINTVVEKYEASKDKKLHLLSKKEILVDDADESGDKYIKYRYGYPQFNSRMEAEEVNGSLERKLKYHNVKQKIQEKFKAYNINQLDSELIESMIKYESINFQYSNNEDMKSKYQEYYLLHIMNHLFKTRDRVLNNNEKKTLMEKKMKEGEAVEEEEFRDQGYTRPKVLILLPSKNFAYKIVNKLISKLGVENVENKKKFKTQFYEDSKISDRVYQSRGKDFEEFFDGNTSDLFVLGVKHTRKTLKLYSPLEQSDIIVASPIGLIKLFNKIEGQEKNKDEKKRRFNEKEKKETNNKLKNNFLSSIEICVVDKAEGLYMQNWSNVEDLINKYLNKVPKDFMNIDFSRIRMWSINGYNKYMTQFLVFNKYFTPEMMGLIKRSKNLMSGSTSFVSLSSMSVIDSMNYKLYQLGLINKYNRFKQMFMKFDVNSIIEEPNKRFEFFKNVILPQVLNKSSYKFGTLIYIPNYFDYLRVKKFFKDETRESFLAIDEYTNNSNLTRNRALFKSKSNNARILLYTERLHFYKRFDIKGVRNVVFYQLPTDPDFYQQIMEFIAFEKLRIDQEKNKLKPQAENEDEDDEEDDEEDNLDLNLSMIRIIYSKLDAIRYTPIVGSQNVSKLTGDSETIEFS